MSMKANFRNDYSVLCHPQILKALEKYSSEVNEVYGLDRHSKRAKRYIREIFGLPKAKVFFVNGGTMANLLFISYVLKPYEAVIACKSGHINVHESGAIEGSGHKIITKEGFNGKLYPEDIKEVLDFHVDEHMVKPKLVYISNSTEIGSVYSAKELRDLYKFCKENGLYLYIDGARLGAALTSKNNDLKAMEIGEVCDAFSIGGAKNGLISGEALVIKDKDLASDFRYHIKNKGAMVSKGYFLGIQFAELFKNTLYFDLARNSNDMAYKLYKGLEELGVDMLPFESNQIFVRVENNKVDKLVEYFGVEVRAKGEERTILRFVTSFSTTLKDIDAVIKVFKDFN